MRFLILLAVAAATLAQSPTFEVASVKPSPPPVGGSTVTNRGGPLGRGDDPTRWTCEFFPLSALVSMAYNLRAHEINAPSWMDTERYNVTTRLPEKTTKDDFRRMLQNLLAERFGLKVHRDDKEMTGYELVLAKNGPKFKESTVEPADPQAEPPRLTRLTLGADGFPELPTGFTGMTMTRGRARARWSRQSMGELADQLSYQARGPVVDRTNLTGRYDISLYWVVQTTEDGPDLLRAVQEQLGLKLEAKKMTVSVLVVDRAAKVPTEN